MTKISWKGRRKKEPHNKENYATVKRLREKYDKLPNHNQRKIYMREQGTKGTYQFMRLPNHKGAHQIIPDGMHTFKDSTEHLIELILGKKE